MRTVSAVFALLALAVPGDASTRQGFERMAAWHHTIVATDTVVPVSGVTTYVLDRFSYMDTYGLSRLAVTVETAGGPVSCSSADSVEVEDFPGGVRARFRLGDVEVSTELMPMLEGRDTPGQDGAALFCIRTRPAVPVEVECGGGALLSGLTGRVEWLRSPGPAEGDRASMREDIGVLTSPRHPLTAAIRAAGGSLDVEGEEPSHLRARFASGGGCLIVAYGPSAERAVELASISPEQGRDEVERYYARLLQCRIRTPEPVLDQAFRSALYNLEYNWLEPYGWNECIHHWLALWHMQHTAAAEWIGQADRSRICNLTTARNLLPDGSVPQFNTNGSTRKDFGGSNQFFAWQVRHYWKHTADTETIREILPRLEEVIRQTWEQYDPDGDGLLAWGQQIGNQEDYISTPYNGATPTMEGINMLRTAAELARGLGDRERAEAYARRADALAARLREQLWQPDIGRYAFFRDPLGEVRPDGQYHTAAYPAIWGLADGPDAYTSVRHLKERLSGGQGEVYCSNNFPNHVPATCGMQAGAAQQPWAAWAFAAAGMPEDTVRPLQAAARWAMSEDHRGAWPEVSVEPIPAYFSPPAGLFIQAVVEALFGLGLDRPEGLLTVSPSFPEGWTEAELTLPEFSASYRRSGDRLSYTVRSVQPLRRSLAWKLPPCRVLRATVDGREAPFHLEPGVGYVTVRIETGAARATHFEIRTLPLSVRLEPLPPTAEGDEVLIRSSGCRITGVDDRCGALSSWRVEGERAVRGRIREGLLAPWLRFGPPGQMTFSRRTVFVDVEADGVRLTLPADVTVLPPFEAAPAGDVAADGRLRLLVRNNTRSRLAGPGRLTIGQMEYDLRLDLPARSQKEVAIRIPPEELALLTPGDNSASLLLPGGRRLEMRIPAGRPFRDIPELAGHIAARTAALPLPEEELMADAQWRELRPFHAYGHGPWAWSRPPLEAAPPVVTLPEMPGVEFHLRERRFVPVSRRMGRPVFRLGTGGRLLRKVYILLIPFLDNHDTFARVARVTVGNAETAISRELYSPGDLDWWCPRDVVGEHSTLRGARRDRHGLLPMLPAHAPDWPGARPPAFPQWQSWARSPAVSFPSTVMNVVEVDPGRPMRVDYIEVEAIGADPAFGVAAVSVETASGHAALEGTPFLPRPELREPRPLFALSDEADLRDWQLEGHAFSVASVPALFSERTLNSLARAGESATGTALSPVFDIREGERRLRFEFQGGISMAASGPGSLRLELLDADSGEVLRSIQAPGHHALRPAYLDVTGLEGRRVRLRLVDEHEGTAYAWIGLTEVEALSR